MWWFKFTCAIAAFVMSCAGAAKMLGITVDLQTKTESRSQHEAIRQEIKEDQKQLVKSIQVSIGQLTQRIDDAIISKNHGKRPAKEPQNE
jgi:hypothetical protein